jgi:hypothetical protein
MAQNRQHLFRGENFAALYCGDKGRTLVPSPMAISPAVHARLRKAELCRVGLGLKIDGRSADVEKRATEICGQAGAAR